LKRLREVEEGNGKETEVLHMAPKQEDTNRFHSVSSPDNLQQHGMGIPTFGVSSSSLSSDASCSTSALIRGFTLVDDPQATHGFMRKLRILVSISSGRAQERTMRIFDELTCAQQFLEVLFQRMIQYGGVIERNAGESSMVENDFCRGGSRATTTTTSSPVAFIAQKQPCQMSCSISSSMPTETHFEFIYEAAWFLTNLAGGERRHCMAVLSAGCLTTIATLLRTIGRQLPLKTLDQFIWMIANISMEAPQQVMENSLHKAIELLLCIQVQDESPEDWCCSSIFDHTLWALMSMMKGVSEYEECIEFEPSMRLLAKVFLLSQDCDLLTKVCSLFVEFTKRHDELMDCWLKIDMRLVPRLMHLMTEHAERLSMESRELSRVCLKLVSCLSSSARIQHCQLVIDHHGMMQSLHRFFSSRDETIKKEASFTVSNLLAGTSSQVDSVVHFGEDGMLIRDLVQCFWTSSYEVQKECVIAITNSWECSSDETKRILVERLNTIPVVVSALKFQDNSIVMGCLSACQAVLEVGACMEGFVNPYVEMFEDEKGDEALEALHERWMRNMQGGKSNVRGEIYEKSKELLEEYFDHVGGDDAGGKLMFE